MSEPSNQYPQDAGTSQPASLALRRAITLGKLGFRVLRVYPNDKRPVGLAWPQHATSDVDVLTEQFSVGEFNIGVACGPQPNGINLAVIDVDTAHNGIERWEAICAHHEPFSTAMHATPSGGRHIFFDAPLKVRNGRLGPGIDIRGDGGQVVVPPSARVVNGVTVMYREFAPGLGLRSHPVESMPEWLCDLLERPTEVDIERSRAAHPSSVGGLQSNADWLRDHWDWVGVLEAQGHEMVRQHGDDVYLRHPTATAEHSAVVHLRTGVMTAWSTNMPAALRVPQNNRDGSVTWSPFDWFVATEHDGDFSAATREINRRREALRGGRPLRAAVTPPSGGDDTSPLWLEPGWYDQRPWMAACRQMAQAVGGSPSAHLLAFLTRWATQIPPGYSIPPINGAPSSFDLLGVIAGTSGSGKTSPMRNAAEMLPITRHDLRLGLGLGSGEGIIEAFYGIVETEDDKGKKIRERRKCIAGVNFAVSEGLIFAELAGRGGTTHITRLCDAWSGASLSTANASADTFRHIDHGQYRLTMVMGIQADMAHELMTDSAASQGFVGRLLFAWAEEPRVSPRPGPPPPLDIPPPPVIISNGVYTTTYLTYPPEVYDEIQAASDQRVGQNVPVEEHHHDLLRCKIAGIVALLDGKTSTSLEDWAIATALVSTSSNVRSHLYFQRRQAERDKRHSAAVARAETEMVVDDLKERKAVGNIAENIRRHVERGPLPVGALRKKVTYGGNRHRFETALALAIQNGWVVEGGGRVEKA